MNQGTTNKVTCPRCLFGVVVLAVTRARRGWRPRFVSRRRSVWDGVYTEAQAKKGETVYFTHCVTCHGDDFAGREQAPALAGLAFMEKWNRATVRKLFEKVEQMPPTQPKSLPTQDYVDVVAYLLSVNELPAGPTALPSDRAALGRIEIKNVRPQTVMHAGTGARRRRAWPRGGNPVRKFVALVGAAALAAGVWAGAGRMAVEAQGRAGGPPAPRHR